MSTTLANDVRNQCSVISDNSAWTESYISHIKQFLFIYCHHLSYSLPVLTYVVFLQKAVKGRQELNNELSENPLVRLDAQQSGGEVGRREEVFDQGTHHP